MLEVSSQPFANRAEAGELLAVRFVDLANRQLAMGAIAGGGVRLLNHEVVDARDFSETPDAEVRALLSRGH